MNRVSALALAAAALAASGGAQALTVTLSTGASCEYQLIQMGKAGNVVVTCKGSPEPPKSPPAPTPAPAPPPPSTPPPAGTCINAAGQPIPTPANLVTQPVFPGGTNNYVFDSRNYTNPSQPPPGDPQGTIQVMALPAGAGGSFVFASYIVYNVGQFEAAISKCPGDFLYYKTPQASVPGAQPCGLIWGADYNVSWSTAGATIWACGVPAGEQWYLSWRSVAGTCPAGMGHTCGQTYYLPKGG